MQPLEGKLLSDWGGPGGLPGREGIASGPEWKEPVDRKYGKSFSGGEVKETERRWAASA
jgi:hypothetical protein